MRKYVSDNILFIANSRRNFLITAVSLFQYVDCIFPVKQVVLERIPQHISQIYILLLPTPGFGSISLLQYAELFRLAFSTLLKAWSSGHEGSSRTGQVVLEFVFASSQKLEGKIFCEYLVLYTICLTRVTVRHSADPAHSKTSVCSFRFLKF